VASLSQGRTAAAQCGLFTHKSVPVIFEPPCIHNTENNVNISELVPVDADCCMMMRMMMMMSQKHDLVARQLM